MQSQTRIAASRPVRVRVEGGIPPLVELLEEASKILSAVAIAFSNCSSLWPAFIPVHDPSRKAYIGIQNMGTVFTRRFEGDLISTQVPVKLVHLEGLYELFVSKFAFSSSDLSTHFFKVHFTMKLTYKTLTYDEDNEVLNSESEITESGGDNGGDNRNKLQWDDDCPWSEWYTAEDPVKAISVLESLLIREVRWCWEESQPLPRMPTKAAIDLSTSLVHKNLQMNVVIDEAVEPRRRVTVAMGTDRQLDGININIIKSSPFMQCVIVYTLGLEQWLQEMSSEEEEETRLQL
ncbi:unnamed protein product [Lactuca saligna]|uniref:Rab3 GTPase-activating protein catalytic subunit n=1 Tax=Lactuca saligna TaxID=75948 RepID=A0AA36EEI5_LACSI|nr:unnamed protein product [Lactuca saligna]